MSCILQLENVRKERDEALSMLEVNNISSGSEQAANNKVLRELRNEIHDQQKAILQYQQIVQQQDSTAAANEIVSRPSLSKPL